MIYVYFGEDDFSIKEALAELKQQVGSPDLWESNITTVTASQVTPAEMVAMCQAVPFLAEKRLVVVEGLLALFQRPSQRGEGDQPAPKEGRVATQWRDLPSRLNALPPSTILVFVDRRVERYNPGLEMLKSIATVREYPRLKEDELRRWTLRRLTDKGVSISSPALRLLCDMVGTNLWAMDSELEKLSLYVQGRTVQEADVRALVSLAREASIFAAVDAVMAGKASDAAGLMHQIMESGATVRYISSMLVRQSRLVLLAKELLDLSVPKEEWGNRLGLTAAFPLRKTMEQAAQHSWEGLEWFHRRLLEADREIKTGEFKEDVALELLIAETCAVQATKPRAARG